MASSTSSSAPLLLHGLASSSPSKAQAFFALPVTPSPFSASTSICASSPQLPLPQAARAAASRGEQDNHVQELRVPDSWLTPAGAAQESEWLRVTLHKWLDDEYCPEPANVDISNTAARSYHESLTTKQSDLGEILLKMVGDLQELSYQESFHGAFSAANAAVRLITQRMDSSSGE
ncbi:uncharacterized protein LOC100828014 [Brachypodium distachyon]|uniref:Uncharacterized protein n=1 Tax=Brachypodium distachyon TaxID=15368 RepID=I1IHW9_BRADI|nr:uncharacterized protein LOC100828014 [Brachypodium distachyon]KQJ86491.1 hypothetical protein BRADI_4g05890v3 [Brachypodium distachyon]|eukprot:XP_003575808.1 uncharacterized protein LOC100828014 [Brachypodium distachyon]